MNFIPLPAPVVKLSDETFKKVGINVFVKRLDLIHPVISGNKWFKLKYNLEQAEKENKKYILTFGGAYSNHLAATAAAAKLYGVKTIGIIRGEKPAVLNPVLKFCRENEMDLYYLSREEYKRKNEDDFINQLISKFNNPYIIPEGGANKEGLKGCLEILTEEDKKENYDYIFCACGTATTLAGLIISLEETNSIVTGISVLKNAYSLNENVKDFIASFEIITDNEKWKILHDYHFGGYAKTTTELEQFISKFKENHKIFTEPVYTGKVFFAVYDLIIKQKITPGSKVLVIHTGGFRMPF